MPKDTNDKLSEFYLRQVGGAAAHRTELIVILTCDPNFLRSISSRVLQFVHDVIVGGGSREQTNPAPILMRVCACACFFFNSFHSLVMRVFSFIIFIVVVVVVGMRDTNM